MAWPRSSRLPWTGRSSSTETSSGHARLLGQGLVELGDVAHGLRGVEVGQHLAGVAGLEPRDHQQRVEDADEVVALLDVGLEGRLQLLGRLGRAQGLVGLVAQAGQRAS